ncbi:hypothetical protein C0Q70_05924 [Pomacea canaliculata]|uniref:Uncharacterized protein n=1 Tax=Pomacea canaliculata TaxID=400727 RepID=A0A2T7PMN8_POMCA|nr:uncharacterized protein LOC112558945 [Pomacea canaliculata]PVD34647.1 hypothetical protein C0Q70_05924 [Pomacea canaliculata]
MDEETLEKMALAEIMKDIKRGAERAQEHGALGWQKSTAPPPNKTFLRNMLMSTLTDRTRKISQSSSRLRAMTGCGQQFSKQQHTDSAGLSSSSFSVTHRATVDQPSAGHAHHRKRKLNFYHDSSNANYRSHQHKSVESTCKG